MGSMSVETEKSHVVCIPYPAQGHINPMLMLAKLLHSKGFHVTFVNTEYNHRRLLNSRGQTALDGLPDFRFQTIPDGLPPSDTDDGTQHIPSLCKSTMNCCLPHFRDLLARLNDAGGEVPPVSCIVSDGVMSFTLDAAEELGVPEVLFWTTSACGFMGYIQHKEVVDRGLTPLQGEEAQMRNGYLDTPVDWIPGMPGLRLKDLPSFIRTSTPDDLFMVKFGIRETQRASRASAIILNTFEELERPVLDAMAAILSPPVYTVGPLSLLYGQLPPKSPVATMGSNLWKADSSCLEWLDGRRSRSVVYVNFGSITVMSNQQLVEFAWGLASSRQDFLWVIRSDLVRGNSAVLPKEFLEETSARGLLTSWCVQEAVLGHPAIGGFLTHSGWNSTLESICGGVPMLCWPFFAEQPTNCRYACAEWGIGMEIDNNVRREEVGALIRDLMAGTKGEKMRKKALAWKESAERAAKPGGSSAMNLNKLAVLLSRHKPICPIKSLKVVVSGVQSREMSSIPTETQRPHAVCIPYPVQGHINPMMKLAKLLHSRGFHITFVNTEYNHRRLLNCRGANALDGLPDFRFQTIPDGFPPSDQANSTQHAPSPCMNTCLPHFRRLFDRLNGNEEGVPRVSCVVSDVIMSFTLDAAEELGVPAVLFWAAGACAFMGVYSYKEAIDRGLFRLRDEKTRLRNGDLDTSIDWIPGMPGLRLRDLPSFIWTSNLGDLIMVEFLVREMHRASRASAIILNTFEDLERPVLDAMASILSPSVYTIGPLSLLCGQLPPKSPKATMGSSLWKEDGSCLEWLEGRRPASVVYVNFGSTTVISNEQLVEFAWGLAGSGQDFLWIIRPDLVRGDSAVLPEEFLQETRGKGLMGSWCPQEAVLAHPAVGGFLTHNGWNSTLESICGGVPMLCWPFFADHQTNCRYACVEWGVGMEVDSTVRREELCALIRELMTGTRGKEMRKRALAWKERAETAAKPGGSSSLNLDNLVEELLLSGLMEPA
ncbi:hypothetical protein Taro_042055 [Colocasia esculenta]|uniref:Glycosyltransferase N-terminal domain-containing protein n=1 Tax=Colocasia esculenta TaxID=4460 RepID=A0A843WN02_COLES|nr:hypothetical protein [Colocasia esculenta]